MRPSRSRQVAWPGDTNTPSVRCAIRKEDAVVSKENSGSHLRCVPNLWFGVGFLSLRLRYRGGTGYSRLRNVMGKYFAARNLYEPRVSDGVARPRARSPNNSNWRWREHEKSTHHWVRTMFHGTGNAQLFRTAPRPDAGRPDEKRRRNEKGRWHEARRHEQRHNGERQQVQEKDEERQYEERRRHEARRHVEGHSQELDTARLSGPGRLRESHTLLSRSGSRHFPPLSLLTTSSPSKSGVTFPALRSASYMQRLQGA